MKKTISFLLFWLVTATAALAQTGWVTHQGDNRVSVKFPAAPQEVIKGTFMAMSKDSVTCVFTIVDFVTVANVDSAALAPVKATPEFAASLKKGMLQSLPGVELADFTIGTWHGFTSYSSSGTDKEHKKYKLFMLLIGSKMYSLSTISKPSSPAATTDAFMASLHAK